MKVDGTFIAEGRIVSKLDLREWHIYAMLVVVSVGISLWSVYQDNVINDDGVWYLEVASLFTAGEWRSAYSHYPWPFYPLLISLVSQATGLGLEYAAHLLNALLYPLVVIFFVRLVQELGADRQVTIAAGIIILIYPGLNDYRSMIIRDAGYWAFFLLSSLLFMRYFVRPQWRYALGWALSMLLATLFRVEGFIFFLFLPLVTLVRRDLTWARRWVLLAKASSLLGVVALVNLIAMSIVPQWSLRRAGRLVEVIDWLANASSITLQSWSEKADLLERTLLGTGSMKYTVAVVVGGLLVFLVLKFIEVLTPVYAVLTAYALKKKTRFRLPHAHLVLVWLAILNVLILIGFVSRFYLLQGRYLVALCLLVMLPIPFVVVSIFREWSTAREGRLRKNWLFPVVCVFLLIVAVDGLVSFGADKRYMKQAGTWVKNERGGTGTVFANELALLYYAGEQGITTKARDFSWDHAIAVIKDGDEVDYYAIRVKRKHPEREQEVEKILGEPVKQFVNNRGDKVLVFVGKHAVGS